MKPVCINTINTIVEKVPSMMIRAIKEDYSGIKDLFDCLIDADPLTVVAAVLLWQTILTSEPVRVET